MPKKTKSAAKKRTAKELPASPLALAQEMMRMLSKQLGPDELIMPEDINAMLASLTAPQASDRLSDEEAGARAEAQDLAFEAMEAESDTQARKLAKRALKLDPDCVDALLVIADLDARTARERIEGLQKAVAAGERSLGAQFINENTGHFWLLLETRPYMRALEALGSALSAEGIRCDAIGTYEKMLQLNPNDNQGVRDPLLGLYLETGNLLGAGLLFKKYKEDTSANFAWARVLERFLAGNRQEAGAALVKARKANRHVEQFMTAQKPLPQDLPEIYSPGSQEEAVLSLNYLGGAWAEHKEATRWLFDQLAANELRPAPSRAALKRVRVPGKRIQ